MEKKNRGLAIASKVLLVIDILVLTGLIKGCRSIVAVLSAMYSNIDLPTPIVVKLARLAPYIFIPIAIGLILKEFSKKKSLTLKINIVILIICIIFHLIITIGAFFAPVSYFRLTSLSE